MGKNTFKYRILFPAFSQTVYRNNVNSAQFKFALEVSDNSQTLGGDGHYTLGPSQQKA